MKVTIVNTSDLRGGAAIAAFRLFRALKRELPETGMVVRDKLSGKDEVTGLSDNFIKRSISKIRFYLEIFNFIPRSKNREGWFAFSPARFGQDISGKREIKGTDIIHLHWINNGFLSVKDVRRLTQTNKPVVWTLHDMWAFTGGCHYAGNCTNYIRNCGDCFFLKNSNKNDLSSRLHREKLEFLASGKITFVAVSNWMAETAKRSSILQNCRVEVIPNPIDTGIYKPADKMKARKALGLPADRFLILSGAANLKDKRKGFAYLLDALQDLRREYPQRADRYGLITFGKAITVNDPPVSIFSNSYLRNDTDIAQLYQAADVFVLPTLEDNLPSTVMEALACGTPVVAFNTGGIPDMVDHNMNGYLAALRDVDDLLRGILWIESHPDIETLRQNCRKKVEDNFSPEIVISKHLNLYKSLLK
jgi:glycosyltransferase involved in cell wall biosynthesis